MMKPFHFMYNNYSSDVLIFFLSISFIFDSLSNVSLPLSNKKLTQYTYRNNKDYFIHKENKKSPLALSLFLMFFFI